MYDAQWTSVVGLLRAWARLTTSKSASVWTSFIRYSEHVSPRALQYSLHVECGPSFEFTPQLVYVGLVCALLIAKSVVNTSNDRRLGITSCGGIWGGGVAPPYVGTVRCRQTSTRHWSQQLR
jgi:hypothetical protein